MYHIVIETKAARMLTKIPKAIVQKIVAKLDLLQNHPNIPNIKKLKGREGFRLRVGNYRILYLADDSQKKIFIYVIGHRKDVYRD